MKPITGSPSYLIRNPYSYCFRMKVPKDLQGIVGKKEIRYSLHTGYVSATQSQPVSSVLAQAVMGRSVNTSKRNPSCMRRGAPTRT
jgi:hypothetical protein